MPSPSERTKRGRHFYGPGPYIEREVDEGLLEALRAGEYALVLGARGSGKTSLRIRTSQLLAEDGIRVATVDLGAIGAETRADAFCASVVIEAGRSLGLADEAKKAWRRSKGPPQMRLRACVREVLLEAKREPLVLFIDELELVRSLGSARDDFFAALRAMSDARGHDEVWGRLSVCLVGAVTRDELISDPGRNSFDLPAREFGPRDFNREQLDAFAPILAPLGVETKALLDALYDWTSGSPALVQWLCGDLLLREVARKDEAQAVEAVVRETFLHRGPEVDPLLGDTARRLRRDHRDPYRTRVLAAYERVLRGETIDLRGRQLGSEGALIVARLKVAGLVAASAGAKLRVRNRVVERAFDRNWVRRALAGRPVSDALERWETSGRRAGYLLRGEALRGAIEWIEGRPDVTPSERDFVLASERAHTRRFRRLSWIGSALSLSLAAALAALYWGDGLGLVAVAPAEPAPSSTTEPVDAPEVAAKTPVRPSSESLTVVASAREVVEKAAGNDEQLKIDQLEIELSVLAERLAIERAERAELLARDPTRRAEGLGLALESVAAWSREESLAGAAAAIEDVPAPVTRALTANLPSPGDTTLLAAHVGPVQGIVFNAEGSRFATISEREVRIWERDTGRRLAALTSIAGEVALLALSPSGQRVAALSVDGALTVWNLSDGSALGPAPLGVPLDVPMPLAPVDSLLVDDGGHVSVLRRDGSLDTVDPRAGNSSARLRASELPRTLGFERAVVIDGGVMADARVAVVTATGLELWDVGSGQAQASVALPRLAEAAAVRSVLATPDAGALVVAFAGSRRLSVWEPAQGSVRALSIGGGEGDADAGEPPERGEGDEVLALSSDGELLASGGADRIGRVWSIETGELLTHIEAHDDPLTSLAFTPDGSALVVGDRSGQLRIHPLSFGEASLPLRGATLSAADVAATVHYDDAALELRWSGGQTSTRWSLARPLAEVAVSVDGSRLALREVDGEFLLVSGAAGPGGEPIARVEGRALDLAMRPDASLIAVAGEDRRISLLGADGHSIATLSGHEAPVERLALADDGARLVSADRSKVVRVWDPGTAALLATFACDRRAEHLAIAGERVIVIDRDGGAELWSTQTRARELELELGVAPITSVALSEDGEWLALGRGDAVAASVELWRLAGAEALARFRAVGPIVALGFADDGDTVIAAEGEGRLARWPARPPAWIAEACASLASGSVVPSVCTAEEDAVEETKDPEPAQP